MALHSEFHMPGAFHSDGARPGLFRPPHQAPSATSPNTGYFAARPTPINDDESTPKRKRVQPAYSPHSRDSRPGNDASYRQFEARAMEKSSDRRYVLGGELSTPFGPPTEEGEHLGESMFSDSDFRRMLGTKRPRDEIDQVSDQPMFSVPPLAQQPQTPIQGWGAFAVTALGGVVGSIWRFCRDGSFKGFHAGGGRGYDLRPSVEDVSMLRDESRDGHHQPQHVPGRFPQTSGEWDEKPAEDAYINTRASTPSRPAAKRRQTGTSDGLQKNWVMVDGPDLARPKRPGTPSRRNTGTNIASPRNRNHGPAVSTGRRISTPASRRTAPRPSLAASPHVGLDHQPASSASFASPRSPSPSKMDNPASPFTTPKVHSTRKHRPSASFTAASPHRRTNSGASVASNRGASQPENFDSSPRLDPEAKKLAARRKRQDAHADARVTGLNQTVEDMIRQCQEALATDIDVEDDGPWQDDY